MTAQQVNDSINYYLDLHEEKERTIERDTLVTIRVAEPKMIGTIKEMMETL